MMSKIVTNILKLPPAYFVSNICLQHRTFKLMSTFVLLDVLGPSIFSINDRPLETLKSIH